MLIREIFFTQQFLRSTKINAEDHATYLFFRFLEN